MQKELRYQDNAERFIKGQWEAYNGHSLQIYKEEFSQVFDAALQAGASPLVRDASVCADLARYGVVGLQQKILELNRTVFSDFIIKHKLTQSAAELASRAFDHFLAKYRGSKNEAALFSLIFAQSHEALDADLQRRLTVPGAKVPLDYNVIFYEAPGAWSGLNSVFIVRERRIPIVHDIKKSERPDFMVYLNGIPLVLVEYKTEDSGIAEGLKDFEIKDSYRCAPFKVAVNDGSRVIFFSNIESLKLKDRRNNAFEWVHYGAKKQVGAREFTNAEYFFDELLCQPQNLYRYCMDGCSVVQDGAKSHLINARIQQYYALKSIKGALLSVARGTLPLPFNFEFSHAQRSGKTITMKLLAYMVAKQFSALYHTIFIYTPDLQIKRVLADEFKRGGYAQASVSVIEKRAEYHLAVADLAAGAPAAGAFKVYIVNMQKISTDDLLLNLRVPSTGVLNIIDEAHYGQARQTAENRDKIFAGASNFLFTATGKSEMYAYYFPDNNAAGFRDKFTISDAKRCGITVPVHYLRAEKTFRLSEKLERFTQELERRIATNYSGTAQLHGMADADPLGAFSNTKIRDEIRAGLRVESMPDKLAYICSFLGSVGAALGFAPKAIVYVDSVAAAKEYIRILQETADNNVFQGYRFGVDFSQLAPENCEGFNPQIPVPKDVEQAFMRTRIEGIDAVVIDVLFAVDKYQKGFDLPELMVTFLDTSILEPARMNQIYTRTATKRPGKSLGYCIDLSLDTANDRTFKESMALYDSNEAKDCFIDDSLLDSVNQSLVKSFSDIQVSLGISPDNFSSYSILQEVLNEPNETKRRNKQEVFFNTSRKIITALSKIGSPLYFRPFALQLKALFGAFYEFKAIYADSGHPERAKILIDLDRSFDEGSYLTSSEIRTVVRDVLLFVEEANLSSLLGFGFNPCGIEDEALTEGRQASVKKMREDEQVNDLKRRFDQLGDSLRTNHKSLYEQLRDLLYRIAGNRALAYDTATHSELEDLMTQLGQFQVVLREKIARDFGGNHVLYWLQTEAEAVFESENIPAPKFCQFVATRLEKRLQIILPQLPASMPIFDKATAAVAALFNTTNTGSRFTSFFTEFQDADEKPKLAEQLKKLSIATKDEGRSCFANDEPAFRTYLFDALKNHYQNLEA